MSPLTESTRLTLAKQSVAPGLLDAYGGAAAAYSLRRLSANYTGPVVRVRRSSDNTEQDFTATQVTDGTLTTFCGAGNGFVRTWYDQSGNAQNLGQSTTANQPQIVAAGSLIVKGTRPSLDFDGSNDRLINSVISLSQPVTHVVVGSRDVDLGTGDVFFDSFNNVQHVFYNKGTIETPNQEWTISASGTPLSTAYATTTNLFLASTVLSSALSNLRINGAQRTAAGTSGANGLSGLSVGDLRGDPNPIISNYPLDGKISEYIIYASNQSNSIAAIESNINAHYAIY
jgi:hypothetical protein